MLRGLLTHTCVKDRTGMPIAFEAQTPTVWVHRGLHLRMQFMLRFVIQEAAGLACTQCQLTPKGFYKQRLHTMQERWQDHVSDLRTIRKKRPSKTESMVYVYAAQI